jgi:hypothetical protein
VPTNKRPCHQSAQERKLEESVLPKQGEKKVEAEETGVEVDSQDGRLVVKLRAGSCAGGGAMIAQSSIMQPAMRMTNPAELRDLAMAAPPS